MGPTDGMVRYGDRSLVYDALADERRRRVVHLLADADAALTIEDIAERLTDDDRPGDAEDEVVRLRTSPYHVHVPKLSEAGIVRFSPDRQRVRLTESVSPDALDALES
ncbi:hypothetical protein I7X12_02395 [Halosimplex litoreum]|uniref:DUF7344 domain-containing protein n=1 Tax=Halosimplex litoreum TaxID=1198301 RepID=A0A7T3KVU8_9EURY|nr:hypothetical protein [Halosimplex litoreum]QPV63504.1 hypothetical protein I7X12_02395 [Halosimplex litoreum]